MTKANCFLLSVLRYYLDRQRFTGDLHRQAPILWATTALLR